MNARLDPCGNPHSNDAHLILTLGAILHNDREPPERRLRQALFLLSRGSVALRPDRRENAAPADPRGGLAPWQIRRVIAYVDQHLADSIDTQALANLARLSKCHFTRAFRRSLQEPPHRYVMRRRIEHACALMLTSNAPLSHVAAECGLADQAHFSRLFRQLLGVSPGAWRRAQSGVFEADALAPSAS